MLRSVSTLLTFLAIMAVSAQPLFADIVAQWHFDEGEGGMIFDSSGTNAHGTLHGATWTDGIASHALNFNGSAHAETAVDVPTEQFTLEAWVNIAVAPAQGLPPQLGVILEKWQEAHGGAWILSVDPDLTVQFDWGVVGSGNATDSDIPLSLNEWHYIAATVAVEGSNTVARLYLDGVQHGEDRPQPASTQPTQLAKPVTIGAARFLSRNASDGIQAPRFFFNGVIDEVTIHNRPLSDEEISEHYDDTLRPPPVADAGADQTVHIGDPVTLDGSRSTDPDARYPLTYSWAFIEKPTGSTTELSDPFAVNPTFTPDMTGDYLLTLTVTDADGKVSDPDTVRISTTNSAPVADGGSGGTAYPGQPVSGDGSGSSDGNGDRLAYHWTLTKPQGSQTVLIGAGTPNPSFTPDIPGDYILCLVVTDEWGLPSEPSCVTISTTNTPPVASAGPDQSMIVIGSIVQLDGTQSYDPDGNTLTYAWRLTTVPSGSQAMLDDSSSLTPRFVADVHGTYVAELVVSDPWSQSAPDVVVVSFENIRPVADAGQNQSVIQQDRVYLDGSGSHDANGDRLTFRWSLVSVPTGSQVALSDPTSVTPHYDTDLPGTYIAQLIVNDGSVDSEPSTVSAFAVTFQDAATQTLQEAITAINGLDAATLMNANLRNALTNQIGAILSKIAEGAYEDARNQLVHAVLKRVDGCTVQGAPDQTDWVTTCAAQESVYPLLMQAQQYLEELF